MAKITKRKQAEIWLEKLIEENPWGIPCLEVYEKAKEDGISVAQLPLAKKALGVKSTKAGGHWHWTRYGASAPDTPLVLQTAAEIYEASQEED
jgi:hypothetical protein